MRQATLFWKLFAGTSLLIVVVLGMCAWLIVAEVDRFHSRELTAHLQRLATAIRYSTEGRFDKAHTEELDRFAKQSGAPGGEGIRITMILANGDVLADSEADPSEMESHAGRREVIEALSQGWGEDTRHSATVSREMRYVALRIGSAETPVGVVRVSMPVRRISEREEAIHRFIWTVALLGLAAAVLFALGLARVWSAPLRRITAIARSLSRGDLSARARAAGSDEMAMLARSLNEMREHLVNQLETIDRQRRTLESLLAQLHEGVVVVDSDRKILLINPAAARMLFATTSARPAAGSLTGLPMEQCVPQHELQQMLLEACAPPVAGAVPGGDVEPPVREARVTLAREDGELSLLAHVSDMVLPGVKENGDAPKRRSASVGRLLVLTDITELTRAVQVKMDFASNASHELRTPLSAIRAAVDTLVNMDLGTDAGSARHFLSMIDRHSRRMEEMVFDLLDLSRIESSPAQFKPQRLELPQLLEELHARCQERLAAKQLQWTIDVASDAAVIQVNPDLLRIVLDNLVDNAIKFTDAGGRIAIASRRVTEGGNGRAVSISVTDNGIGIAECEQDRVFERFYQVEKARSGANRGTGLGLSIVRHAVAAMKGRVSLQSKPGEGTSVTMILPQAN